jgi:hypothetical protein
MPKKYCGYKTSSVKSSKKTKSGKSRRAHSRRRCYNTDNITMDRPDNCLVGMSKSCVVRPDPSKGQSIAMMEERRRKSRERRQKRQRELGGCAGKYKDECVDPCYWVSGEYRQYCRKPSDPNSYKAKSATKERVYTPKMETPRPPPKVQTPKAKTPKMETPKAVKYNDPNFIDSYEYNWSDEGLNDYIGGGFERRYFLGNGEESEVKYEALWDLYNDFITNAESNDLDLNKPVVKTLLIPIGKKNVAHFAMNFETPKSIKDALDAADLWYADEMYKDDPAELKDFWKLHKLVKDLNKGDNFYNEINKDDLWGDRRQYLNSGRIGLVDVTKVSNGVYKLVLGMTEYE